MNDPQKTMFDSFLQEMRNVAERMFNRKLSESALLREHNAMNAKLQKLENRSLNAATERGELLNMIQQIRATLSNPEKPEPPNQTPPVTFKPGEVVMVCDNLKNTWEVDIFKYLVEAEYPYQCSSEWRYCRKLTSKEKGE